MNGTKKVNLHNPLRKLKGSYTLKVFKAGTKELLRESHHENLVVLNANRGLNLLIQALGGLTIYPLEIDNASIGTGDNVPADSDTDLETPVLENIIKARTTINVDNLILEFFMTNDELANGTYTEFGLFCGNQLFARSIISPSHTKADFEDTLIEYTITADNT